MYNRKALKQEAKQLMAKSKPHYMLVALVYILLTTGLSYAVTFLTGGSSVLAGLLSAFLNILIALFSMVLVVGFSNYALCLTRGQQEGMGDLFEPFNYAGRSIVMRILTAIYLMLWILLASVVSGVLMGIGFVLMDEGGVVPAVILIAVAVVLIIVFSVWVSLRYAMVNFALADNPNDGAGAAIHRAVRMMRKQKGKLFVLMLSFIGWNLLVALIGAVVMGIGMAIGGTTGALNIFTNIVTNPSMDPTQITEMFMSISAGMTIWTILAEVICLPLTMWLSTYQQVSLAKFYDYVSGYDYHQYMNVNTPAEEPAPSGEPAVLPAVEEEPVQPETSAEPEINVEPETPAESEIPAEPETPAQLEFYRSPAAPEKNEPEN